MVKKPKDRKIVKIKVYKGDQILLNQDGSINNKSHYIKTEHGTNEWKCLMENLKHFGYCEVHVEDVNVISENEIFKLNESEIKSIKKEVNNFFNFENPKYISPEQKKIKELEEKINNLLNDSYKGPEEKTDVQLLRSEYYDLAGKRCSPKWDKETLEQKIEELKA